MTHQMDNIKSYIYKKIFLVLSIFVFIHTIIFYIIYKIETDSEITHIKTTAKQTIQQQQFIINSQLEDIKSDLSILSNNNILKDYLQDCVNNQDSFANYLKMYSLKKKIYDQIRFIDLEGNEKIRINYNNGEPIIVSSDKLQNKKDRYYFTESISLNKNDIYMSDLDLNVEAGKIEEPVKPMIRFATPVFKDGKKIGILILNYLGEDLLHKLMVSFKFFDVDIIILNQDGYWILNSNDKSKEWGFMYPEKKHFTFQAEYPNEWNDIIKHKNKELNTENGYFYFSTINLYKDNLLKIMVICDKSLISQIKFNNIKILLPLYFSILFVGFAVIYIYQLSLKKHKMDQNRIDLMSLVFKHSKEGIIITDKYVRILEVNNSFTTTTGYNFDDVYGKNPKILQSGWNEIEFYKDMWNKLDKYDYWEGEISNRKNNGEIYLEWLSIYKIKDINGNITNYVGIFSDITKQKEIEDEIYRLAHYDTLTKLPNRNLFNLTLSEVLEKSQINNRSKVALLFIDLDNFKYINDVFGHFVGDKFLQKVANRIEAVVSKAGMTARLGGDEFVVIIDNFENNKYIQSVAKNIILTLSKPFNISKEEIFTSASIGISVYPDDATIQEDLIKHADIAMYIAKKSGKNTYQIFDKNVECVSEERFSLETQLHKALDNKEFILNYQPQVDTISGKIVSFEALIRWKSSTKGIISPMLFIPIAEETGLIHPIGEWILRESFAKLKDMHNMGYMIDGSVNLSSIQLKNHSIADKINTIAKHYKLDPKYVKLEITESVLMENIDDYILILNRLSEFGFKISIDDFVQVIRL